MNAAGIGIESLELAKRPATKERVKFSNKFLDAFYVHTLNFAPIAKMVIVVICLMKVYSSDALDAALYATSEPLIVCATVGIIALAIILYVALIARDKLVGKIANRVLGTLAALAVGMLLFYEYPNIVMQITKMWYS